MQLFVVPRSIPSTFAIIFFSTFFRPPWATQDLSKDRAKRLEIAQNPNFQGKYAVTHDTPATLVVTICHIVADLFMLAFQCAALFRATVLALRERPIPASFAPLGVYIYAVGGESCRNRLTLEGSARLRPKTKPRSASSGTGQTAHAFVTPFGEKRDSSRALHPPSAARYFVGGIPPPRLARVRWRITRTVVAPFPCARSSHMRR